MKVSFNIPTKVANQYEFCTDSSVNLCHTWFKEYYENDNIFLTKSCNASLDIAFRSLKLNKEDEVILPSYTFVACANSIAQTGAKLVFVDVEPDTMVINPECVEKAITKNTKAVLTVNYNGHTPDYTKLKSFLISKNITIVEDSAHSIGKKYQGSNGDFSCISFDHMKNITCGQGGLLVVNNEKYLDNVNVCYDNGTNRQDFFNGKADCYEWTDIGSNYQLSELNAGYLYAQLKELKNIQNKRKEDWNVYYRNLSNLNNIELPPLIDNNYHIFYIKTENKEIRNELISYLKNKNITAVFHYTPLHTSYFGKKIGRFSGKDVYTTKESNRLLRLPLYHALTKPQINYVCEHIEKFYE